MSTTATESETERIVREEQEAHDRQQQDGGIDLTGDADTGQLLKMPRVQVAIDDTDPSALKLAFSGQIVIERGDKPWVDFYNQLRQGKPADLRVGVHVAGSSKTHRRDKEGDVDAIFETKSLIVTDVYLDDDTA